MTRTIKDIRDRCRMVDGHWLWSGALSDGWPRIAGPEYTRHDGAQATQHGRRAVWHMLHKKPIPKGWRVFATCNERTCVNPEHMACEPTAEHGRKVAESGDWKGQPKRITAVRASARKRSKLSPELIELIRSSPKNGQQLAEELDIGRTVISKVRSNRTTAFTPVGGLFTGLMLAANESQQRVA